MIPIVQGVPTSADAQLMALQGLCGMRRYVSIETNAFGTTITARGVGVEQETFGHGAGLAEAINDMIAKLKS